MIVTKRINKDGQIVRRTVASRDEAASLNRPEVIGTVGTDLLTAIESKLGRQVGCSACRSAILQLNRTLMTHKDVVTIVVGNLGGDKLLGGEIGISELVSQFVPRDCDPFEGEPVLHFGAHVWPIADNWRWHVNLWNQMPRLINGRCFVGIAVDGNTRPATEVRAALHPAFEVREFDNTHEGENHTFRWLQEVVPSGQNDVLIYCHAKGAQAQTAQSEAVRQWSEAMYQTVVFNHDMIRDRLANGFSSVHSFRQFGRPPLMPRHRWHPSGTFFAVRAKHLPGKRVQPKYGGVEAWLGDHFRQFESWCEFWDNSNHTHLYDAGAWQQTIGPALVEWQRIQRFEHV